MHTIFYVMVMPARRLRHPALAHSTKSPLVYIHPNPLLSVRHAFQHTFLPQVFAVHLPFGIKRVIRPLDFLVPLNHRTGQLIQFLQSLTAVIVRYGNRKHPISFADCVEILLSHPTSIFLRMPPLRPPPKPLKDQVLHAVVRLRG